MNFHLDILDKNEDLLDVANIPITSVEIQIDEVTSDLVASPITLKAGNTYRLTFPATSNPGGLGGGTTTITSPDDGTINTVVPNNTLLNGGFVDITVDSDVTQFDISELSSVGVYEFEEVVLSGEDITITIDDGNSVQVFEGVNTVDATLVNNSVVTLTVESSGYFTYTNQFTIFTEDINATVMMIANITDINDPEYMQPFSNFFIIQDPCSFNVYAIDGTNFPFGTRSYYLNDCETPFNVSRNGVVEVCEAGNYTIRQVITTVGYTTGCGCVSVPSYTVESEQDVEVLEYRPDFTLINGLDCCIPIGESRDIYLSSFVLNNTVTGCDTATLTYVMTYPNGSTLTGQYFYEDLVETPLPLEELNAVYNFNDLGTYTLNVTLENCCTETTKEFKFDACASWIIENIECNIVKLTNLSTINTLQYTIKQLTDNNIFEVININEIPQENIVLGFDNYIELDLLNDGIYTITIEDNEYLFLLDCNIRKCKEKLLIASLCDGRDPCKCGGGCGCHETDRLNLIEFTQLANVIYRKWNYWRLTQNIYNTLDINAIIDRAILIKDAIAKISVICKDCGTNTGKNGGCGC